MLQVRYRIRTFLTNPDPDKITLNKETWIAKSFLTRKLYFYYQTITYLVGKTKSDLQQCETRKAFKTWQPFKKINTIIGTIHISDLETTEIWEPFNCVIIKFRLIFKVGNLSNWETFQIRKSVIRLSQLMISTALPTILSICSRWTLTAGQGFLLQGYSPTCGHVIVVVMSGNIHIYCL